MGSLERIFGIPLWKLFKGAKQWDFGLVILIFEEQLLIPYKNFSKESFGDPQKHSKGTEQWDFGLEILNFEEQLLGMAVPLGWRLGAPTGSRKWISRRISWIFRVISRKSGCAGVCLEPPNYSRLHFFWGDLPFFIPALPQLCFRPQKLIKKIKIKKVWKRRYWTGKSLEHLLGNENQTITWTLKWIFTQRTEIFVCLCFVIL